MARKATSKPTPAADKAKEPEGAVSAQPDGIDVPAVTGTGAVSAVPDLPGENTEH